LLLDAPKGHVTLEWIIDRLGKTSIGIVGLLSALGGPVRLFVIMLLAFAFLEEDGALLRFALFVAVLLLVCSAPSIAGPKRLRARSPQPSPVDPTVRWTVETAFGVSSNDACS
jgi:hypothetical protein